MVLSAIASAQAPNPGGSWTPQFNHETGENTYAASTDPFAPFGGVGNPNLVQLLPWPAPDPVTGRRFNAVHMALIPWGPNRGRVLVWNIDPVVANAPNFISNLSTYWSYQPYAIVDPDPNPVGVKRFQNFLLPIAPWPGGTTPPADLFCAGQAWSENGDLIVAGGTLFSGGFLGATLTYAFNPGGTPYFNITGFPTLYAGASGMWVPGPPLAESRFYPTVVMSQRLTRTGGKQVAFVLGGSIVDGDPNPLNNLSWNHYEGLQVFGAAVTNDAKLRFDPNPNAPVNSIFDGPGGTSNTANFDLRWLMEYPRCHLLTIGEIFFSAYAPQAARLDPEGRGWTLQAITSSTGWPYPRVGGASVVFPNVGGMNDVVVRLGGCDKEQFEASAVGATNHVEYCLAGNPMPGNWIAAPPMQAPAPPSPPANGRYMQNTVLLPDASLLTLGGCLRAPGPPAVVFQPKPEQFKNGAWTTLNENTNLPASQRDYHSTAVLLPDGRLFVGGGNNRNRDYEIYSPPYLTMGYDRPTGVTVSLQGVVLQPDPVDGALHLTHNTMYQVSCAPLKLGVAISSVVLISPGATTHHSDMSQRYYQLPVVPYDVPYKVDAVSPPNDKHLLRGFHMLFVVTSQGGVSFATWVTL